MAIRQSTVGSLRIVSTADMTDIQRYNEYLRALIVTRRRTLPGSRGFGLDQEYLDYEPNEAANMMAMSLAEQTEEFVPELDATGVEWSADAEGHMIAKINMEGSG